MLQENDRHEERLSQSHGGQESLLQENGRHEERLSQVHEMQERRQETLLFKETAGKTRCGSPGNKKLT